MNRLAVEVLFVLPASTGVAGGEGLDVLADDRPAAPRDAGGAATTLRRVPGALPHPYATVGGVARQRAGAGRARQRHRHWPRSARLRVLGAGAGLGYDGDLLGRIHAYAQRCERLIGRTDFDVIHAHDWMTFPAAQRLAARSGRPMIAHVHATEFDRSGTHVNQQVYEIERAGMHAADLVIAVSHRTRQVLLESYGVMPEKVRVVHNGIEPRADASDATAQAQPMERRMNQGKTVLFLGRLTMQKGPGFFIRAAMRVLERVDDVKFIVAGWGDLAPRMIEEVAARGLGQKVLFTGFLRGAAVDRAFRAADVYVMPSVSEPFGLTALEAIRNGAPVVLSRSSGVAEVLDGGALVVDCWDVQRMADQIVALLTDTGLAERVRRAGAERLRRLTWDAPAQRCVALYEELGM
ncbi:MAG: glycosyltransferase family 4 protein [Phycisphaeraceae bacterium]